MNTETECPVCTLFLRAGISLEEHLDTHAKEQLIKLVAATAKNRPLQPALNAPGPLNIPANQSALIAPLPAAAAAPAIPPAALAIPAATIEVSPNDGSLIITQPTNPASLSSGAARSVPYQPRYTNELYSGPPPPYSRATQINHNNLITQTVSSGQLPIPVSSGQLPTPASSGQLPIPTSSGQPPIPASSGQLPASKETIETGLTAGSSEGTVEAGPSGLSRASSYLVDEDEVLSRLLGREYVTPFKQTSYGFEISNHHRAVQYKTIERSHIHNNRGTTTTTTTEEVLMRLPRPKAEIITVSSSSSSDSLNSPRKPSVTVLSNVKLRSATDDPEPTTQSVRPVRPSGLHRYDGKRARISTTGEGHPAVNSLGVGLETSVIRKTPHPPASPVRPSSSREHTTSTATESLPRRHRRITLTARMSTGGKVESHKRHQAVVATKQRSSSEEDVEEIELEPIPSRGEDLAVEGDEEEEDDDDEDEDEEEEIAEESEWEDDPGQNGGSGSGGGQQSGHSSSDNKENDRKYHNSRQGGRQRGSRKRKGDHSSFFIFGSEMSRGRRGRRDIPQQLVKLEPESEPPAVYQAIADQEPPLLPRASLECFEMVDATAMVEVEVETEDLVDRKPTESMLSQDAVLYGEDRTMSSSISSFAELCEVNAMQAAATPVKIEGMLFQAQQQPATVDAQPATVIPTTPPPVAGDDVIVETDPRTPPASIEQHRDVKDFLEVGEPSLSSTSKFAGAAGAFEQHSGAGAAAGVHRPASYYRQSYDVKDFLEAGPSSRAASESVVGPIASAGASDGDRRQQQHPFQLYSHADVDYASEFHRALSTNSAFTSGASSPDNSEAVPGVWAHRFSPQYSSAVLAANGGLLGSADRSASASPIGAHNGGAGNGGGHGTAASYGEDNSSMEEEEDTDITGTDDKPAVTNAAISTSRHSSSAMSLASSIVSCSMERAPSTESLNIRTDEKMPAKGEISEQESNGDMELTPWKRLCAVSENIPVYPSSYDYSTAQECWNLSNRLGTHSAAISRMPFPFSSGSQASLTNYPSRGSGPVGGYKKEVVGDEDEDDYDEDDVPGEDEDEEERERSGSMKSTIPKVPFGELGANLELQLHQEEQQQQHHHQQQVVEQSAILVPYVDGMREEKYLPKGAGALDFEEFAPSSHHYGPAKARTGPSGSRGSSKPSGSGIARTYRCVKCMEPFSSIKQRREHMRSVHPEEALQLQTQSGELQHHQQQQQQLELSLPSELLGSGLLTEDVKTGVTGEKPPPEPLAPVVMDYHWLRQEIQRKYELGAQPSNTLVLMTPTTTVVRKRLFVCAVCRAEFERFNQFNAHLMVHPAECMACGRHFKQWRNFALHLKRHLGIKEHGCRVCGKHFVIKQKLIEHMRVHSGHAPIRCKLCNRHFKRFSNLAQHSNRYHLNKVAVKHEYVCSQCGDVFPTRAKMEWHKETHEQKPKPCPYCREKFIHQNSLTRHIRLSHTLQYAKLKNKTEPCTVCQQPYTKASMRRHMETHTEERLVFSCGICNKHFTTNWNLKQHKWTHANPTMKPFQCTLCPAGFVRESDYLTHVNAHRSIRPYTCNHCGRQFIRKYNWLRHSREHETDKSHKCDQCGRQFHRKYYLTEHKRMHSGERPYACNICGKTSSTKTNHNKHVRIHHARDPLTAEG